MMTRSEVVRAIDRIRDFLLIAKDALVEDDMDRAEEAITNAAAEVGALVEDLRA